MSTLETPVSAQAQLLRAPARATRGPAEPARAHVVRWPALGSTALVAVAEREDLEAAVQIAERELAALDLACSRFRSDSELSRANACNRARPVQDQGPVATGRSSRWDH